MYTMQVRENVMSSDLITLIDAITPYGTIAGSFARYYMLEGSAKPADLDIVPFSTNDVDNIGYILEKEFGYENRLTTENAMNMSPEGGRNHDTLPEVDILLREDRLGVPTDFLPTFPLHNEAFVMLNSSLCMALDSAIEAENRQAVVVQNWYRDTHLRAGKLLFKEREDGFFYHLDVVTEGEMLDFVGDKITYKVKTGEYRRITSHTANVGGIDDR